MKILHTADWHIGQNFLNKDREEEFHLLFDWIIELITRKNIDVLIIAGDIFDVAYPSNSAMQLYYDFLTRLLKTRCKHIVITGGNHDAVSTLEAAKDILRFLNIHIIPGITDDIQDEIIEIKNNDNNTDLVICAVPFLRDRNIRRSVAGENFDDRTKAIKEGIARHYQEIAKIATKFKEQNIPVVATGHLLVTGASQSDSEREIYIGNLKNFEVQNIPEIFDYVALGHIHRPQKIAGRNNIRYSGSPLQLSFSERNDTKQLILVDFDENTKAITENIDVPKFRELVRFSGSFEEVMQKLKHYNSNAKLNTWAEVVIEEENYDPEQEYKYRQIINELENIQVLKYAFEYKNKKDNDKNIFDTSVTLQELDVKEVFQKLLDKQKIEKKDDLILAFDQILEETRMTESI